MLSAEKDRREPDPQIGKKRLHSELANGLGTTETPEADKQALEAPDELLLAALNAAETNSANTTTETEQTDDMRPGFVANVAHGTLDGFLKPRVAPAQSRRSLSTLNSARAGMVPAASRLEDGLPACWRQALSMHFKSKSWQSLSEFLEREQTQGKRIFPPSSLIFHAFQRCPLEAVKVVIIGQDPYHNVGQAHGLCFSVPRGVAPPPSLLNIYGELAREYPENDPEPFRPPMHGCLEAWADQGVLLLNAVLTVEAHKPGSHAKHGGWQKFTDEVIRILDGRRLRGQQGLVFMLWGNYAKEKCAHVNASRHLVLQAAHPSPMAASRGGWFGCNHFRRANEYLQVQGYDPIRWHAVTDNPKAI
jgi:uracil-DNA glycosylase